MPYSQFTNLAKAQAAFKFQIQERFFINSEPIEPGKFLSDYLSETRSLVNLQSEKAKSEGIVFPVLMEVRRILESKVSLFSGVDLNVSDEQGLTGICDFVISASPVVSVLEAPILVVVEAKDDSIKLGLGQCVAEMIASRYFNLDRGVGERAVYGIVTTGELWRFLRLNVIVHDQIFIDIEPADRLLDPLDNLLGAIVSILRTKN